MNKKKKFKRDGVWTECMIVAEANQYVKIVAYTWQGITYHTRVANYFLIDS